MEKKDKEQKVVKGIVTAQKCDHCGHHEIGIKTDTGEYITLKPGRSFR